jgi:lysozyme
MVMFDGIIDINHNNDISLSAAKAAGIVAVIHKATEGATFQDPLYASRRAEATKLGLLWGAYHFGTAADTGQQLQNFLEAAQLGSGDFVALDYETNSGDQMTLQQAEQFVAGFLKQRGSYPLIYGSSLLHAIPASSPLLSCRLWIAAYKSVHQPALPAGFKSYALWQFTDGTAPTPLRTAGATVDRDRYDGTEQQLTAAWPLR